MDLEIASKIVSIMGTIVAAGVGIWGLRRWRMDKKATQAEFLEGLIKQFADDEILRLICSFDSDGGADQYFRNPTDIENRKVIEKSLNLMSYLCYLHENKIIPPEAFIIFESRLRKTLWDAQVRNYIVGGLRDSVMRGGEYPYLVDFMRKMGIKIDCQGERDGAEEMEEEREEERDGTIAREGIAEEEFNVPTAIIKINRLYRDGMSDEEIYAMVRGWWRLRLEVANKVKIVLAVAHGIVRGVYAVKEWVNATNPAEAGRIGFVGESADNALRKKFIGRSVNSLFNRGASNPVRYFGMEE